jgi:peptide/nickel transport system substrate-binding protein
MIKRRTMRFTGRAIGTSLVVLTIALTVIVSGSGSSAYARAKQHGRSVAVGIDEAWNTLDVQVNEQLGQEEVAPAVYDTLVALSPNGRSYVPYLAKSWVQTPTSVTFHLRRDATCSNGTRVTAAVVRASFRRLLTVPKPDDSFLSDYFGPGPYSISANAAKWTFTFRTKVPFRYLLGSFSLPGSSIICPAGLARVKKNPTALQAAAYGSGPYTLKSDNTGVQAVFKLRHDWTWGPNGTTWKNLPGTLTFKVVANMTTAANLLLTGGLNVAEVEGPDLPRMLAQQSLSRWRIPSWVPVLLDFNMAPGHPTDDIALRAAISANINRSAYNTVAFAGLGVTSPSVLLPKQECFDPKTASLVQHGLAAAKSILTSAGYVYSNGKLMKNGQQVNLTLVSSSALPGGEYIFNQVEALGINVNFQNVDQTTFAQDSIHGDYDLHLAQSTQTVPDPGERLTYWWGPSVPDGGLNFSDLGAGDPTLNNAMTHATETLGAASCHWFDIAQQTYLSQHYVMPLAAGIYNIFSTKGITVTPGPRVLDPVDIHVS